MVYIQSNIERKIPHHFDAACALYGAIDNAQAYRLTSVEEVTSGRFDSLITTHLFVGSVEFMTEVFKRINKVVPSMKPSQEVKQLCISDAINRIKNGEKLFIKPVQTKLFSGMVFDSMCISMLEKFTDKTEVWIGQPFESEILSEWRFYIRNRQIVDVKNYSGDFTVSPNFKYADEQIVKQHNFPSCYTMDIAILKLLNQNVIVEFNDMWAIGNYGINNSDYYKMLRERYFEIVRYDN